MPGILKLAASVYDDLSEEEIDDIERIALNRSSSDMPGVKANVSMDDILNAVRESRKHDRKRLTRFLTDRGEVGSRTLQKSPMCYVVLRRIETWYCISQECVSTKLFGRGGTRPSIV